MSKAQILMHQYFDAAWNQGKKGIGYSDTQLPEHKELIGYVFDLEQRLAAAESRTCELQEDSDTDSGAWLGDCGAMWTFINSDPKENSCVYCPQCGGKLVVAVCPVKEDSGKGE